jgi:hypothetical protein
MSSFYLILSRVYANMDLHRYHLWHQQKQRPNQHQVSSIGKDSDKRQHNPIRMPRSHVRVQETYPSYTLYENTISSEEFLHRHDILLPSFRQNISQNILLICLLVHLSYFIWRHQLVVLHFIMRHLQRRKCCLVNWVHYVLLVLVRWS